MFSEGVVTTSYKFTADFGCWMAVEPYPFDIHYCGIEVSVASDAGLVSLVPGEGQQDLMDMPESFVGKAMTEDVNVTVTKKTPNGLEQTVVGFLMEFKRDPAYVQSSYILIAYGLNMVSFGSVRACSYHC